MRPPFGGSVVPPEFDFPASLPPKDDSLLVHDRQPARNEPRIDEFFFRDLPFPAQRAQVCAPRHRAGGNVIISSDFYGLHCFLRLVNANNFIEMPRIMTNPLSC